MPYDGLQPHHSGRIWRYRSQPLIPPQITRDLIQQVGIHSAPLTLQPMGADGYSSFAFHEACCTFIQSLMSNVMFATVYRCRHEGALMDRLEVQTHPVAGELVVHRRGFNRRIAKLLAKDGETYLIPVLDKVRLLTINERGVLLSGYEMHPPRGSKGSGAVYPQTWWCVTSHVPGRGQLSPADSRAMERARALRRESEEIGRTMSAHSGRRE